MVEFSLSVASRPRFLARMVAASVVINSLTGLMTTVNGQTFTKTQSFSTNPMWDAFNTTTAPQNFGWQAPPSHVAGGVAAGEAGGTLVRDPLAFYADNVGSIDPSTTALSMSGKVAKPSAGSGNALVGWFNKFGDLRRNILEFVGFQVNDRVVEIMIGGSLRLVPELVFDGDPGDQLTNLALGTPFTYDLQYNPTGGAFGAGRLTATFVATREGEAAATYTAFKDATVAQRDAMANLKFNRFGLLTWYEVGSGSTANLFFDDMTYTSAAAIPDPTDYVWAQSGSGNFQVATNWNLHNFAPDANTDTAVFGSSIQSPSTVFSDSSLVVKGLRFDNSHSYNLAGGGDITLQANSGSASLQALSGSHQIQLPLTFASPTTADIAAGSAVAINNALSLGGNALTKVGAGTLLINNDLHSGGGSIAIQAGVLGGGGTIGGSVNNSAGKLSPGANTGQFTIAGAYAQSASASLAIEIGGAAADLFDSLQVIGTATIDGVLEVSLVNGYTPAVGTMFTVLTATNVVDQSLVLGGSAGNMFSMVVNPTNVRLTFTGLGGDANGDGDVDGADFLAWQRGFGTSTGATPSIGNFDGDGDVDGADLSIWRSKFGTAPALASSSVVPEPSTTALGLGALIFFGVRFRFPQVRGVQFNARQWAPARLMALTSVAFLSAQLAVAQTHSKTENFDDDPLWEGSNNRPGNFLWEFDWNLFGPTSFAGGASAGEIGGTFKSHSGVVDSNPPASYGTAQATPLPFSPFPYFADNVGALDPSTAALTMAGKGNFVGNDGGSSFLGWFDKDTDLTSRQYVGGNGTDQFIHFIGIGTDDRRVQLWVGSTRTDLIQLSANNVPFSFSISYDPTANGGAGALTGSVTASNGQTGSGTRTLGAGVKDTLNNFDRFGILARENLTRDPTASNPRITDLYYDDLTYTTAIPQTLITQVEWALDSSASAGAGSWNPSIVPNSDQMTAILGSAITGPHTVVADANLTMKTLRFDNASTYTVAGLGTINLSANVGAAAIEVLQGSHEVQAAVSLHDNLTVTVASGSTLTLNNVLDLNGFSLTKMGGGSLVINNIVRLEGGSLNNPSSGVFTVMGTAVVPEPTTPVLVTMAMACLAIRRRRSYGPTPLRTSR